MKKLFTALALSLCTFSSFAADNYCNPLATETFNISKEVGHLVMMPKQPIACRAKLAQASTEVLGVSGLIQAKVNKLAKKGLEHSVITLLSTIPLHCQGFDVITKAEADLLIIAGKLA